MVALAVLLTLVFFCLLAIWLLAVQLDDHRSLQDSIIAVLVLLVIATVITGVVSAHVLVSETTPHYYPVIIKVPTMVEHP